MSKLQDRIDELQIAVNVLEKKLRAQEYNVSKMTGLIATRLKGQGQIIKDLEHLKRNQGQLCDSHKDQSIAFNDLMDRLRLPFYKRWFKRAK